MIDLTIGADHRGMKLKDQVSKWICPIDECIGDIVTFHDIGIYENKRTDFQEKEIARLVQNKWNDNFINDIKIVIGDEWFAGNLSYHLASRPIWFNDLKNKAAKINDDQGVIYVGNPKILKEICPGVFGKIAPVGYCMIGKR